MSIATMARPLPALPAGSERVNVKETDKPHHYSKVEKVEELKLAETMDELNQTSDSLADHQDDLQRIKGIGPSIAQALNQLGIHRYADLADFTSESLAALLKDEISSMSPQRIKRDDWLVQAQALAQNQEEPEAEEMPASKQRENTHQAPNDASPPSKVDKKAASAEDGPTAKAPRESWRELADFFVSFGYALGPEGEERLQTKVHHSQADKLERWEGVATDQLIAWMLEAANLSRPPERAAPAETETPVEPPPSPPSVEAEMYLELSDLWVSEVTAPAAVGRSQPLALLRAESRLNLSGSGADRLTGEQLPFAVELYLVNTETSQSQLAATYPGRLVTGELTYEIQQDFLIPPAGHYQLYLIARLLPPGSAATHLQGPVVRVEP